MGCDEYPCVYQQQKAKTAWLQRYLDMAQEIDSLTEEQMRWRALAQKTGGSIIPQRVGGTCENIMVLAVEKIIETERLITEQVDQLLDVRQEISDAIWGIPDTKLRTVLRYRYLSGNRWEEIADKMGYDFRYIFKLHQRALDNITTV